MAKLGSNCNNGSKAGLFNWNVNNTSSNSNWNIGSHLVCVFVVYCDFNVRVFIKCRIIDRTYGCSAM